jgi:hypothetical protein
MGLPRYPATAEGNYIVGDLEPSAAELSEVLAVVVTPGGCETFRHGRATLRKFVAALPHPPGENMTRDTDVWRVRAAAFRRIAKTSEEAERERKMLVLAAKADERAVALDREPELSEG